MKNNFKYLKIYSHFKEKIEKTNFLKIVNYLQLDFLLKNLM